MTAGSPQHNQTAIARFRWLAAGYRNARPAMHKCRKIHGEYAGAEPFACLGASNMWNLRHQPAMRKHCCDRTIGWAGSTPLTKSP
jgi:hypothetical protein